MRYTAGRYDLPAAPLHASAWRIEPWTRGARGCAKIVDRFMRNLSERSFVQGGQILNRGTRCLWVATHMLFTSFSTFSSCWFSTLTAPHFIELCLFWVPDFQYSWCSKPTLLSIMTKCLLWLFIIDQIFASNLF